MRINLSTTIFVAVIWKYFPDDVTKDGCRNVGLFTIQPHDTAASAGKFH
jgi:hypothetical protein